MGNKHKKRAYVYRPKKSRREQKDRSFAKVLFLIALFCLIILQTTDSESLGNMQHKLQQFLTTELDIQDAIETLGRSFSEKKEGENTILVFGRMILGLEDVPFFNETVQKYSRNDLLPLDETGIVQIAGPWVPPSESAVPILTVAQIAGDLSMEEQDDSTINEVFKIPSPDIVDDTVYDPKIILSMPLVNYRVTSSFGYRIHPISGNTTFHYGADLAAGTGTKVVSVADGTISETGYGSVNGNYIKIAHDNGYASHYTHLNTIQVKKGEEVRAGERIGTVGSTGYSTGPHLHFELRRNGKVLDPFAYFDF